VDRPVALVDGRRARRICRAAVAALAAALAAAARAITWYLSGRYGGGFGHGAATAVLRHPQLPTPHGVAKRRPLRNPLLPA